MVENIVSNFYFSHNVFHSYISIVRQSAALCGNGLIFAHSRYIYDSCGGQVVRASALWAGVCVFNLQPRQTKVFKTGGSGFPPWCSGLWQ